MPARLPAYRPKCSNISSHCHLTSLVPLPICHLCRPTGGSGLRWCSTAAPTGAIAHSSAPVLLCGMAWGWSTASTLPT